MPRCYFALLALLTVCFAPSAICAVEKEVEDVIIYGDLEREKGNDIRFNEKSLGHGKPAMAELLKLVSKLPQGTSIVWGPNYDLCGACGGGERMLTNSFTEWSELEKIVEKNGLFLSSCYPGPVFRPIVKGNDLIEADYEITWTNYRGADTPHDEVLYQFNGDYLGRGEAGFKAVLDRLRKAPQGKSVYWTRYEYRGRWASEWFTQEQLRAKNAEVAKLLPFAKDKKQLDELITQRKLAIAEFPFGESPFDWGDRYGQAFVTAGKIIRHDEKPRSPQARLGWIGPSTQKKSYKELRDLLSTIHYTLDDVDQGAGVAGFTKAMERLEKLPEGAVVQVKVCLRTKGPFTCPLIYEGQRHFERTGFEPYAGLYPWLLDVAAKRKLQIEWIPDEGKSCYDCELNR